MKKQKKPTSLTLVFLYALCAALWSLKPLMDFSQTGRANGLEVLAALAWIAAFLIIRKRYQNDQKNR